MTTRSGGVSQAPYDCFNLGLRVGDDAAAVGGNRGRLARTLGVELSRLVWMNQVHGDDVAVIGSVPRGEPPVCDALVTGTRGLVLAVLVADCVPVLLAEPVAGVIGAAHAGREGVRRHVVSRTVEAMVALGAAPHRVDALLGPAICGRCYPVSREIADEVAAAAPGAATRSGTGDPALDLRAALGVELGQLGVATVVTDPRCTAEDLSLFSHRRDGVTGRQAGLVWLT